MGELGDSADSCEFGESGDLGKSDCSGEYGGPGILLIWKSG